jgi:methylated-DNA-[protein]-cysteine S-methyltransferase
MAASKEEEVMDTCSWTQKTPVGSLAVELGPAGVRSVKLGGTSKTHRCDRCAGVQDAFARYFGGDASALDGVAVDLSLARSEFNRRVLKTLREVVRAGDTITYGGLAVAAGRPGAARAVGSAMANNPVPILIPCHRVLRSEGGVGNYGGGPQMKRFLLKLEGAQVAGVGSHCVG